MSSRLKKVGLVLIDIVLAAYIVVALCAFNKPEAKNNVCQDVSIVVSDATTHGFIDAKEIMDRLQKSGLNPKGKHFSQVSCRQIEEALLATPFVRTVECYKNEAGIVNIKVTQRMPTVRIKSVNGDDYYIDDKDKIMPKSDASADLIIATGHISRSYATMYVAPLARALMADDMSRNMFQQIHITKNMRVELVPRIGNHVVALGRLPESNLRSERNKLIEEYVGKKMKTLVAFYKHGLSRAGWNKYSEINIEYDNQIICKRIDKESI